MPCKYTCINIFFYTQEQIDNYILLKEFLESKNAEFELYEYCLVPVLQITFLSNIKNNYTLKNNKIITFYGVFDYNKEGIESARKRGIEM